MSDPQPTITNPPLTPSLFNLLNSKKLEDLGKYIQKGNKIITINTTESLHDCFGKLILNNIHTLPIFDPSQNKYVGILDSSDFAPYLLLLFGGKVYSSVGWNCQDLTSLSERTPFRYVNSSISVLNYLINSYWKGFHSIPVCREGNLNDLIGMASQSSLVQWLLDSDLQVLGPEIHYSISKLKIGNVGSTNDTKIISVPVDMSLIQVIDTLVYNKLSAVAIVDSSDHLIGNLSTSDLALVKEEDNLKYLNHPIHTYLSTFGLAHPITCTENDTLYEVMKKLCENKIHRVYCMTPKHTLQSVINLSDVLEAITTIATRTNQIQ